MSVTAREAKPAGRSEARPGSRTETAEALGRAFKAALAAVRRMRGRETHRPGQLSYAQYGLLFALCDGEAKSSRELALAADISAATAAEMLDSLAATGLVRRSRSADDKRIVLTSLTERGKAVVDERRARYEPRWLSALAGFSQDELRTTARVLEALRAMFDELAEAEP
ncbi:MAG TPA: MarR family transcriptional regulator [Solirubrobacteraceae bacterium]|nr:MarR family transcriptional regulator [Solirubrobacteraceae bacterium]